ncbi:MAG: proline dehydrogenase family protein [Anaerolineae bacterium]
MLRHTFLYLSERPALKDLVLRFQFAEDMARRFVAGETLDEAIQVVRELNGDGLLVTLDHVGEHVLSRQDAERATATYLHIFDQIDRTGVDANVSLKLTQLGLDLGDDVAYENLRRILEHARECRSSVEVDMEGSAYTQRTLDIHCRLREAGFDNVGAVVQAYLYRTEADVERLIQSCTEPSRSDGSKIRLCKGAYDEPPEIAFPDKADVDRNYVRLTRMLFSPTARERGVVPAIATHDEKMIDAAKDAARRNGVAPEAFEFQMLYGIRSELQQRLADEGHQMRVYVPYGTEWYPYFMRRMAERPANVMFVARAVLRRN